MRIVKEIAAVLMMVLIIVISFPTEVHAYIDPSSGSLIIQILGMAFITLSGFFFIFKNKIRMIFGKEPLENEDEEDEEDEEEVEEDNNEEDKK